MRGEGGVSTYDGTLTAGHMRARSLIKDQTGTEIIKKGERDSADVGNSRKIGRNLLA